MAKAVKDIFINITVKGGVSADGETVDFSQQGHVINWMLINYGGDLVINDTITLVAFERLQPINNLCCGGQWIRNLSQLKIQGDGVAHLILSILVDDNNVPA